ncbi:hypothetical protein [Mycolicibacterium wolinskyi]|uniref:hypothetical protein n=1 Tax=Mycolicibacterium wolinskyi TaxID=59750 RepID=UPI003917996D
MIVSSVAGCRSDGGRQSGDLGWPEIFKELRIQWSAEPGIELVSGVAVPARAYFESRLLLQFTGDPNYAYPGFSEAVAPNEAADSPNIAARDRRPDLTNNESSRTTVGNIRFHVLSDEEAQGTTTVTICRYIYAAGEQRNADNFVSVVDWGPSESRGITAMRAMIAPVSEPTDFSEPQAGPEPSPRTDVFKGWKVTGFLASSGSDYVSQAWPDYQAADAACLKKAPDPTERREFLTTGEHPRSDFPTSPPSPGWPEAPTE